MKNFAKIVLFLFFVTYTTLQAQECIVLTPPGVPSVPLSSFGDPDELSLFQPTEVRTIYIAAHIVRSSNGTGGITQNDLNTAIQQLKLAYTDVMIDFVHNQTDYIDNDTYENLTQAEWFALSNINTVSNKLNVYFVPGAAGFNGIAFLNSNKCAVTNAAAINGSTLAHEVGHNLYLYHTHGTGIEELVDGSNCTVAGDFLCDTPAEPYNSGSGINGYVFTNTCVYFGTFRDANNQLYTPDTNNFMGLAPANCREDYSSLQIQKMNQTLSTSLSYLIEASVPLANKISGNIIPNIPNVQTSTLTVVGVSTVNSGTSVTLLDGNSYDIKTNQERFPNYLSYGTIKHNNWNGQSSQFKLTENYTIDRAASPFRDANNMVLNYSKIEVKLEGQLMAGKGASEFQDPWFILSNGTQPGNYWKQFNSYYEPTGNEGATEKGIFLNQNPDPNDPNKPYYSVKADQTQDIYLNETGKTHRFYFQNWSGTEVQFENNNALETGVVFQDNIQGVDPIAQANLKGTQLSDDAGAFLNNSQRKFVRTDNGDLHMVYESMGKAFYEISTDNGSSWQIANNGQPLSGSEDSKLPAIDYERGSSNDIAIVWQENYDGNYKIKIANFLNGNFIFNDNVFWDIYLPYSYNTNPAVAWDGDRRILVVWQREDDEFQSGLPYGILYSYGSFEMTGGWHWNKIDEGAIPSTNSNSINPTLVADKDYNLIPAEYHLAWEQQAGFYSYIKYFELSASGGVINPTTALETPSNGAGFWTNRKPSIIVVDDHTPRLVWIGYTPWYGHRTVFRAKQTNGLWSSTIINYGSYSTESVNINRTYDNNYAFVFSESYTGYQNKYVKNSNLWTMNNLGTTGRDIQVCNADNFYNMFCLAFQSNVTLPYRFVQSSSFGNLNKQNKKRESIGRAAIVTKDSAEFIYALGDVLLNDEPIKFKDVKDTIQINSQQELNNYLKSKPFYLDNRSALSFSVVSGVVNPRVAPMLLEDGKYVKFKVELIEDKTGEILNSFAILEYNANNVEELTNLSFSLKTSGMRKTKVHLKILLDENISGEYTLSELIAEDSVLHIGKEGYQEVSFGGDLAVIEYALEQNYPNPFNPSTTLKYQIPQNGFVTLKVYDILGKEVATLVNEVKTQGRYEVNFNASNLASGVYLYRLNVNDYVDVKKMILLK